KGLSTVVELEAAASVANAECEYDENDAESEKDEHPILQSRTDYLQKFTAALEVREFVCLRAGMTNYRNRAVGCNSLENQWLHLENSIDDVIIS
ncbi:hypothetical protein PMAYCL1PPCAC_28350, partial [Pristionchus mayeri]